MAEFQTESLPNFLNGPGSRVVHKDTDRGTSHENANLVGSAHRANPEWSAWPDCCTSGNGCRVAEQCGVVPKVSACEERAAVGRYQQACA